MTSNNALLRSQDESVFHLLNPPLEQTTDVLSPSQIKDYYVKSKWIKWADNFLLKIYKEIIWPKEPHNRNLLLIYELNQAARAVGVHYRFDNRLDIKQFPDVNQADITSSNPVFRKYLSMLWYIFDKGQKGYRHNDIMAKNKISACKKPVNTLFDSHGEEITVTCFPMEIQSSIDDSVHFENKVLNLMCRMLRRGFKWISGQQIASLLKVDRREFESWADHNKNIKTRLSHNGVDSFYGLKQLFTKNESAMNIDNTPNDSIKNEPTIEPVVEVVPAEVVPAESESELAKIGSEKFEAGIIQFLTAGSLWRTIDAMAQLGDFNKEEMSKWADTNGLLVRRASNKDKDKVYYALLSRMVEKKAADAAEGTPASPTKVVEKPASAELELVAKEKEKEVVKKGVPLPTVAEIAAFSMLHSICDSLLRVMNCYANRIATRYEEPFSHFTKAQKHLVAGVALLQKEMKIADNKLPKSEDF